MFSEYIFLSVLAQFPLVKPIVMVFLLLLLLLFTFQSVIINFSFQVTLASSSVVTLTDF